MLTNRLRALALVGASSVVLCPVSAATITFDASDSGWYRSTDGLHTPLNENFFAGADLGSEYHNFFVFDLASQAVPGNVVSVILRVENVPIVGGQLPTAPSPDMVGETYSVFEVLSTAATVTGPAGGVPVFTDLGDGTLFGSLAGLSAEMAQTVDVAFNAGGVGAVSSALVAPGLFVVGGSITSIGDGTFLTDGEDFFEGPNAFDVGGTTRQLIIETDAVAVPEPSTVVLLGIGLLGVAALARRRRG